jgi:ureidoglycolate hydrolase
MHVIAEPLAAEGFAPFGEVPTIPARARVLLSIVRAPRGRPLAPPGGARRRRGDRPAPAARLPCRPTPNTHPARTQHTRWGVTYFANIWHQPLSILDRSAAFAFFMWRDGGEGDEEFATLPTPITILAE